MTFNKAGGPVAATVAVSLLLGVDVAATPGAHSSPRPAWAVECAPGGGGIRVPTGFCAIVVADLVAAARHLVVTGRGDIYVRLRVRRDGTPPGGIVALRDVDGDGIVDEEQRFGATFGTGIEMRGEFLYVSSDRDIVRFRLSEEQLGPEGPGETIVRSVAPRRGATEHPAIAFAFGDSNGRPSLLVHVGAPSNACQVVNRARQSYGRYPCPELEAHAGVWRFRADERNQTLGVDGVRIATGLRHTVALERHPTTEDLYAIQHGRDGLGALWPDLFTAEESAELPAEELLMVSDGANFGWPYCFYDPFQDRRVLSPEYGGDGVRARTYRDIRGALFGIRCHRYGRPQATFPAHSAPNDLVFYTGTQFPARFRDGAFVALHGGSGRSPYAQQGYQVVFVPLMERGGLGRRWEVFADGFAGDGPIMSPGEAAHRPMGLALGPDGSLYVSDSVRGRIWRIVYSGEM